MQLLKYLVVSVTTFLVWQNSGYTQNIHLTSVVFVVNEMAAHNIYESSTIGFALQKSKQYERFQQMNNIATDDQLIELASNHENGVVRLYAYQALKQRNIVIPKHLTEKFKNDQTRVNIFIGCIRDVKSINSIAVGGMSQMNFATQASNTSPGIIKQ
jgi:hypothetical protein